MQFFFSQTHCFAQPTQKSTVCMHSIPLLACAQYLDILVKKNSKQSADDIAPFRLPIG